MVWGSVLSRVARANRVTTSATWRVSTMQQQPMMLLLTELSPISCSDTHWRGLATSRQKRMSKKKHAVTVTKTKASPTDTEATAAPAATTTASPADTSTTSDDNEGEDKEMQEGMPDPEMERRIQKLQHYVRTHHEHGQYHEALSSSEELLQTTEDHFGTDHPATATAYNNIGLMHKLLGDFKASRKNYHQALRIYDRVVGKDHASYAAALHNLGNLNRSQVFLDESMSAMERLQLNEVAVEYLEEAWQIRKVELGVTHPHTVASRSSLGSTIAAQVLQQVGTSKQAKTKPSKLTRGRWEAAEQHLRDALETAIANPRGETIAKEDSNKQNDQRIVTLSAAAAAQNLAVFLKCRVTATEEKPLNNDDSLAEARQLYESALRVRTKLLHDAHPDTVATKYSLAELLSTLGDEEGANALRNEIVDSYDVVETNDDEGEDPKTTSGKS